MRGALNTDIDPVWLAFAMIAALWVEPAAVRHQATSSTELSHSTHTHTL